MEKTVRIFTSFAEAEEYDIEQQITMTPSGRMAAARELKKRVYGTRTVDIRAWHRKK